MRMAQQRFISQPFNKPLRQNRKNGIAKTKPINRPQLRCRNSQKKIRLNPARSMCWFFSVYSGITLYRSKALFQSASFMGGTAPMMGSHTVMLRPLPVRRVTPPITTMHAIITQPVINQATTGFSLRRSKCSIRAAKLSSNRSGRRMKKGTEAPFHDHWVSVSETQDMRE